MKKFKIKSGYLLSLFDCLLATFICAGRAFCGGSEYGLQGAETVGRGGANTAKASGPESIYLNVAGISKSNGLRILLDSNFVSAKMKAKLFGDEEPVGNGAESWYVPEYGEIKYVSVNNSAEIYPGDFSLFPAPIFGITFPFPWLKRITVGFAILGPAALGSYQFPETVAGNVEGVDCAKGENSSSFVCNLPAPQRYDLISEEVLYIWPTIALSYKLTNRLAFGAGFQWGVFHAKFKSALNNGVVQTPRSYINDVISFLDVWDYFVPAGIFGLSWNPVDRVEFGLGVRISDKIRASGKVKAITNPWGDDPISSDDPTITWMDESPYKRPAGSLSFPWPPTVWRFGIRYKHPRKNFYYTSSKPYKFDESFFAELFDVELDVFLEQTHVVESMDVHIDGSIPYGRNYGEASTFKPDSGGNVKTRRNWRDVISVRLGGSVNLLKGHLTINWGGFYESPTVYDEDTRLDYLANERFGIAGGLQGRLIDVKARKNRITIEAAISYVHFFFRKIQVRNGKIRHISSLETAGTVINNGDYNFTMDILTAGVRITLI